MKHLIAGTCAGVAIGLLGHEFLRDWGASELERVEWLPGDDLVPDPADSSTLAIDVDAPAAEVWRWLVQMGQDRGGMYSYDKLERVFGLRIENANRIHEEWQTLAVGDTVRLVPRGWLGLKDGLALPVAMVVPGESVVLRMQRPQLPWDAVWSFHIVEVGDLSRLISRSRGARAQGVGRFVGALLDPVTWLMTRRMLVGIKIRAERSVRVHARPDRAVVTRGTRLDRPSHDEVHAAALDGRRKM